MNRSDLRPRVKKDYKRVETSISTEIHQQFKILVDRSGITQSAYLRSLIEDEVQEYFPELSGCHPIPQ